MKKPTQKVEIMLVFSRKEPSQGPVSSPGLYFRLPVCTQGTGPVSCGTTGKKPQKVTFFVQLFLSPVFSSLKLVRRGCLGHAVKSSVTVGTTSRATTSPALVIAPMAGGAGAARKVRNTPG